MLLHQLPKIKKTQYRKIHFITEQVNHVCFTKPTIGVQNLPRDQQDQSQDSNLGPERPDLLSEPP